MATRNPVGRRLLSDAELEFANPFDETIYSNILETFNAPTAVVAPVEQSAAPAPVPSIDEILIQGGGNPVVINDVLYQPIFASTGQGETFEQGPLTQVVAYNPGETDPGQAYKIYTPDMQEAGTGQFQEVGNIGDILQTAAQDLAPLAAMALTAGGAGGSLGGFLSGGSLTGTAASALGNALISGGAGVLTGQDPLKAALLAAAGTYAGSLFGGPSAATESTLSDAQFIAADAAQLAAQGIAAPQIEQILQASGVNLGTAVAAADAATSGMSVDQIAKDITLGNRGLFTDTAVTAPAPTTVVTSPEGLQTVTVPAAAPVVNAGGMLGGLATAVPATVLPEAVTTPTVPVATPVVPVPEQVTVTAPKALEPTLSDALAVLGGALTAPMPPAEAPMAPVPEQVTIAGTAQPATTSENILAAAVPAAILPQVATPAINLPPLEPVGLMAPEAPQSVEVTGTAATPEAPTLQDIIVALTGALPPEAPVTPVPEQVTVTAPKVPEAPEVTLSDALAALSGAVTSPLTSAEVPQTVEVTSAKQQTQPDNALAAVAPLATIVPPAATPPNEVIEVTGTAQPKQNIGDVAAAINAGTLYGPGMTGAQTAKYDEVLEKTGSKEEADKAASTVGQLTLKDLYTALQALGALSSTGLFGGGGGGGTQRSFVAPTATVPMGNADYYNAVQQYYNTYMPQTPRDVATPLQQWYEGKFGG